MWELLNVPTNGLYLWIKSIYVELTYDLTSTLCYAQKSRSYIKAKFPRLKYSLGELQQPKYVY